MLTILLAAGAGYLAAHASTRTTILNWAMVRLPVVLAWVKSKTSSTPSA